MQTQPRELSTAAWAYAAYVQDLTKEQPGVMRSIAAHDRRAVTKSARRSAKPIDPAHPILERCEAIDRLAGMIEIRLSEVR